MVSTFDDLGLKEDLLRGIYAYSTYHFVSLVCTQCSLDISRLREAFRHPTTRYPSYYSREGRHCTGAIRDRKDSHFLHFHPPVHRCHCP